MMIINGEQIASRKFVDENTFQPFLLVMHPDLRVVKVTLEAMQDDAALTGNPFSGEIPYESQVDSQRLEYKNPTSLSLQAKLDTFLDTEMFYKFLKKQGYLVEMSYNPADIRIWQLPVAEPFQMGKTLSYMAENGLEIIRLVSLEKTRSIKFDVFENISYYARVEDNESSSAFQL